MKECHMGKPLEPVKKKKWQVSKEMDRSHKVFVFFPTIFFDFKGRKILGLAWLFWGIEISRKEK